MGIFYAIIYCFFQLSILLSVLATLILSSVPTTRINTLLPFIVSFYRFGYFEVASRACIPHIVHCIKIYGLLL